MFQTQKVRRNLLVFLAVECALALVLLLIMDYFIEGFSTPLPKINFDPMKVLASVITSPEEEYNPDPIPEKDEKLPPATVPTIPLVDLIAQVDKGYQVAYKVLKSNLELSKATKKGERYDIGVYIVSDVEFPKKFDPRSVDRRPNPPLTVLSVAKDSPAEKAGILKGDKLLKVNNHPIRQTPVTFSEQAPTVRHRFYYLTNKYFKKAGIVNITLSRNGTEHEFYILPELVCNAEPNILIDPRFGAYVHSDYPKVIFITAGLIATVADDAKIALIFGHELAHLTRSHLTKKLAGSIAGQVIGGAIPAAPLVKDLSKLAGSKIGGMVFSHKYELKADYFGLYHAARAGYDVQDAAEFFYDLAEAEWGTAGHSKATLSHPSSIERFLKLKETINEIDTKITNKEPLIPNKNGQLWLK